MANNRLTYKVRCRSCATIREFVFYSNTDAEHKIDYSNFFEWVNEHATRPLYQSCHCSEEHTTIQDLISFSKEDTEHYGKFDYNQRKKETRR